MKGLNDEQLKAATAAGSVAVTAGAGTGKTHMLAYRYLHHVSGQGMSPLEAVAVTFTEKAADELRSRIRATLRRENAGSELIAEVDAAQISTIHALAARICRDFYDIAGIPPDFSILDPIEFPMWLVETLDEAVAAIDPATIEQLGYGFLRKVMPKLLAEPITSRAALSVDPESWRTAIAAAAAEAAAELRASAELLEAVGVMDSAHPIEADALSSARECARALSEALISGEGIRQAAEAMDKSRPDWGSAPNWPNNGTQILRPPLKALKQKTRHLLPNLQLELGDADMELHQKLRLLRSAFHQANDRLQTIKRAENLLDFNDLEYYALQILNHPEGEALQHYRRRWKAFLVDEYQDTSPAQEEMLELLMQDADRTIVGDEKQAIYGFRGADIDVFARSRQRILETKGGSEIPLSKTYRTHRPLVESNNLLFKPVLGSMHKDLESARTDELVTPGPYLSAARVQKPDKNVPPGMRIVELEHIAETIREVIGSGTLIYDKVLKSTRPAEYRDMAILCRKWSPLGTALEVLSADGIPAVNTGGGNLLETQEARDAAALLNFLAEPTDGIPLVGILRSPFFGISDEQLFDAAAEVRNGTTWWDVVRRRPEFERAATVLRELINYRKRLSAGDLLRMADRQTGYRAVAANLPHGQRREADWQGMIDLLAQMERRGEGGLFDAVRHLGQLAAAQTEVPRPQIDAGNAVTLMTIHKAKGLEWPIVFVCGLSEQSGTDKGDVKFDRELGAVFKLESDGFDKTEPAIYTLVQMRRKARESDEAKRLLYVAVTRARDRVYLTSSEGGKGTDRETLLPGFDAVGVIEQPIEYRADKAFIRSPQPPELFAEPRLIQLDGIGRVRRSISATAITSYMTCPRQFRFRHMDGHPGAGEGFARASTVGTLTHLALEHDIADSAGLLLRQPEASDDCVVEALRHAECFRSSEKYAAYRSGDLRREEPFSVEIDGLLISGKVDLVGADFVLDYKTDESIDAEHHRFQIWVYAHAMKKPRGILAYLKNDDVREFGAADLAAAEHDTMLLIEGIRTGKYEPTPSSAACRYCSYRTVCDSNAA